MRFARKRSFMQRSDNDMVGGQRHTISVRKTPEGLFEAKVENDNVKIPPVVDKVESLAIRLLGDKLNAAHLRGEIE